MNNNDLPWSLNFSFLFFQIVIIVQSTHLRADVVLKQSGHEFVGGFLEHSHHCLVQRVSVLIQPAGDIVWHLQWNNNYCYEIILLSLVFFF